MKFFFKQQLKQKKNPPPSSMSRIKATGRMKNKICGGITTKREHII